MTIYPPKMAKMEKAENIKFWERCKITRSLLQISDLCNQFENQFAIINQNQ